jgi:hypothetical protein
MHFVMIYFFFLTSENRSDTSFLFVRVSGWSSMFHTSPVEKCTMFYGIQKGYPDTSEQRFFHSSKIFFFSLGRLSEEAATRIVQSFSLKEFGFVYLRLYSSGEIFPYRLCPTIHRTNHSFRIALKIPSPLMLHEYSSSQE